LERDIVVPNALGIGDQANVARAGRFSSMTASQRRGYMSPMDVPGPLAWRKSLRSVANGACVEVAPATGTIVVRDSVNLVGPVIRYSTRTWQAFIADAKTGSFDIR
jgi:hypothetical protein